MKKRKKRKKTEWISTSVLLTKEQRDWMFKNSTNMSLWVRQRINEKMKEDEEKKIN